SFALILVGLFIAGPWLTMAAARGMARWTSRASTLMAARRLADNPSAAFRAVGGLVLALFITTVAVAAITTQDAKNLTRWGTVAETNVVTDQVAAQQQPGSASPGTPGRAASIAPLVARLQGIHGVQGVVEVHADPRLTVPGSLLSAGPLAPQGPVPAGAVSCAQLAAVAALGRCPAGVVAAAFPE